MTKKIPNEAVKIQEGLYMTSRIKTINSRTYTLKDLYSEDGYCFYDKTETIYDENGNIIDINDVKPNQRMYMQYASLSISKNEEDFVSILIGDGFNIV